MSEFFPIGQNKIESDSFFDKTKNLNIAGEYNEFLNRECVSDGPKSEFLRPAINERRLKFLFFVFASILGILAIRSGHLQIVKGAYYHTAAEENRIRTEIIPSWRGIIYDRNQKPLVRNVPTYSISLIPADIPKKNKETSDKERKEFLLKVASIIDEPVETIENILENNEGPANQAVPIKGNLEHNKAISLMVQSSNLSGVSVDIGTKREYLVGDKGGGYSLSHVLGYEGKINKEEYDALKNEGYLYYDDIGKIGIELSYERELRGVYGRKQIEVDATGRVKNILAKEDPKDGSNVMLSIDYEMQKKLEDIMVSTLWKIGKRKAAAIVMDPNNGEILAMVSLPSFFNNDFSGGIESEKYNELLNDKAIPLLARAISGEYPPGSTIKLIMSAAALQEKIITPATTVLSLGGIQVSSWFFPDWKAGGHGITNVRKAIAESVNTFFYYVGGGYGNFKGLGVDLIGKYLKLFGIGEKLGIDINSESTGFVPTKEWKEKTKEETWYIGDTYHLAIGQGDVLVTPLQVASYTSVFANGGTLYKPHLVKKIFDSFEEEIIEGEVIRENFVDEEYISVVRGGMRQTVTNGSAIYLNDLGVAVAGKTGTAQWSTTEKPHAWFTGFAPYDNPELVITVLVEEAGEGSAISVPIAKEFLRWYFYEYK